MATAMASRNWSDQFRSNFEDTEVCPLEEGATALMYACQQENVEQLQAILARKPEAVRERDRTLKTVLHYCAENSSLSCAEIVLTAAPDIIDVADEDGYTTLHLAVIAGNIALVNFLISKLADVNALDSEQHSVIHWATVCGEVELLQILLNSNADPSTPDVHGGYPIHYAAQMCGATSEMTNDSKLGLAVLKALIDNHVDVNVVDRDGRQPVLWAASAGSSDAVIALINAGASVRAHDKDGLTALHCAASRGHTECLETLIELCAAEVDVCDNNGCSPLFYSTTLGHADATQLLLQYGANPNRQDRKGRTPAHCGAAKGQFETLKILKKHNANLWLKNVKGDYCLHEAVNSGRKELVKWLLAQKPNAVNAVNGDGRSSLHIAAISNNIEMCKILLDHQSLVNPVMHTAKGELMTPLDAALHKGNRGCAKYLQLHGGVPAKKLSNHSAAIRGPHRIETHSDYQGSPDGKLEAPFQVRETRSLDTSPLGYQSRSRKVEVCIRANVSSENINEVGVFSNVVDRHHRSRRSESNRDRSTRGHRKEQRNFSDSVSSSDLSESSSNGCNYKTHRRRQRQRQYTNRKTRCRDKKSSRSKSQSCCRCSPDDESRMDDKGKKKTHFKVESVPRTGDETKQAKAANQHTVTAVVHREDEHDAKQTRASEKHSDEPQKNVKNSENGIQEVHSEKLSGEQQPDSEKVIKEVSSEKSFEEQSRPSETSESGIQEVQYQELCTDTSEEMKRSAEIQDESNNVTNEDEHTKIENDPTQDPTSADEPDAKINVEPPSPRSEVTWSDLKSKDDATEEIKPETKTKNVASTDCNSESVVKKDDKVTVEPIDNENKIESTNQPDDVPNSSIVDLADSTSQDAVVAGSPLQKSELEKLKTEKLEEHYTKDKGLICVILDDDETIEIKRRRDVSRSKSEHHPRTRSPITRKKEKNPPKRQRRSRSSFEILSDDANNEDYSSRLTVHDDSGFEPSPRNSGQSKFEDVSNKSRSRIPRATNHYQSERSEKQNENEPDINVTSVTQAVQSSVRKYHLERKVFHTLLELKRLQIRAGKSNEQVLVKRLVDDYQKAGLIVGLRPYDGTYSFRHFEKYLYEQLRILQTANKKDIPRIKSSDDFERLTKALKRTKAGKTLLENVPDNPLFCTHGTHRCIHATHAYTGIPCAAYIAKLDHHKLPKPNENYRCFLPRIDHKNIQRKNPEEIAKSLKNVDPSKPVTLELIHGTEKQIISLPTEKLDKNKRYCVTFTIKGANNNQDKSSSEGERDSSGTPFDERVDGE